MITRLSTIRNLSLFTLLVLSLLPGCRFLQQDSNTNIKPPATPVPQQTAENLVNYLNTKASNIQTLSYADIKLRANEDGRDYPKLADTYLFVSQPRNLRLVAGHSLAGKQLDVGSNDREFWIYAKPLQTNQNFFYCSHDDFSRGNVQMPIPFDTDWVMQALGMQTYPLPGQYTMETRGRDYILSQRTATRTGIPITKLTYFNADNDSGKRPVVKRHIVQDDRGQVLASAEINQTHVVSLGTDSKGQPVKVQVPVEVTLEWPAQKYKITLSMREEKVNEDLSDRAAMLFTRPKINGTSPIDLANYRTTPTSYRGQAPGNEPRHYYWPKLLR